MAAAPEYELLKEKIRMIEARVEEVAMAHRVDIGMHERKITDMSSNIHQISETLDSFQDAHIVIKRPEAGIHGG